MAEDEPGHWAGHRAEPFPPPSGNALAEHLGTVSLSCGDVPQTGADGGRPAWFAAQNRGC